MSPARGDLCKTRSSLNGSRPLNHPNLSALAEVRGFLHAFEWVNSKSNHCYSFEISTREKTADIDRDVAEHFSGDEGVRTHLSAASDWRDVVFKALVRWLLAYLRDAHPIGRLEDSRRAFSLSSRSSYEDMIASLIERIESISPIISGYTVPYFPHISPCLSLNFPVASSYRPYCFGGRPSRLSRRRWVWVKSVMNISVECLSRLSV